MTAPRDVGARWKEAREQMDGLLGTAIHGPAPSQGLLDMLFAARRATDEALIEATVRLILGCGPERRRHFINESNFQAGAAAILGELEKNE